MQRFGVMHIKELTETNHLHLQWTFSRQLFTQKILLNWKEI